MKAPTPANAITLPSPPCITDTASSSESSSEEAGVEDVEEPVSDGADPPSDPVSEEEDDVEPTVSDVSVYPCSLHPCTMAMYQTKQASE